ncbi:MAG: mandelate racemase [Anaerolineae bacterium]|nr:mandelate racemase [Anaerolineae bacterium]
MKITNIETLRVALPLRRPHRMAGGLEVELGKYVIVKIHTDEGITGLGEAPVLKEWGGDHGMYFGETAKTVMHMIDDYFSVVLQGEDPFRIEHIHNLLDRTAKGHFYAKAAIDFALYDIVGKALDTPVYNLLGGLVREKIPLAHSLGIMPVEAAVTEALQAVDEGIKTIKLKIGLDPERDVATVRAVRQAVGPSISITVDGNEGYRNPTEAIRHLKRIEEFDVLFVEQPVAGLEEMARVAAGVNIPLMADESAWTPQDILRILDRQAAEVISLYPTKPGGLFPAKKVAAVLEAGGLTSNVNGSAEMGICNAVNLHLSASTKAVSHACVYPVTNLAGREQTNVAGRFYLDDIITEPFKYEDGYLYVPHGPGLGVELDEEKIAKYRIA